MRFPCRVIALTPEERVVWDECPVCHAEHAEPCRTDVAGLATLHVNQVPHHYHYERLAAAPFRVEVRNL